MTPWPRLWSKENNFDRGELPDPSTQIVAQTKPGFPSFVPAGSRQEPQDDNKDLGKTSIIRETKETNHSWQGVPVYTVKKKRNESRSPIDENC